MSESIFGSVALVTFGHVAKKWNASKMDGLVTACDPTYLEGKKSTKIGLVFHRHLDGKLTGDITAVVNGTKSSLKFSQIGSVLNSVSDIQSWEKNVLQKAIRLAADEGWFTPASTEVGVYSSGEGGEVRVSEEHYKLTPGALAFAVSFYDLFDVAFDSSNDYGLKTEGQEPKEYSDYGCVLFSPDPQSITQEMKEAMEYLADLHSANLFINLIEKWNSVETSDLSVAWKKTLESLPKETYAPTHINAARIARDLLSDVTLYRKLLDQAILLTESGVISGHSFGVLTVANELADSGTGTKEEIYSLLDTILPRLSLEDPNDLCTVIENIASTQSGLKLGDLEYAKKLSEAILAKIEDKKVKAKFKMKIDATFKNTY